MADPQEEHDRQLLAEFRQTPYFEAMQRRARKIKKEYMDSLAVEVYENPEKVTEAALNEKRAYFKGMARLLNETLFDLQAVQRDLARKEAQSD